jgi:hypothetical protein
MRKRDITFEKAKWIKIKALEEQQQNIN